MNKVGWKEIPAPQRFALRGIRKLYEEDFTMELPKYRKFAAIMEARTDEEIGGKVRNVHVAEIHEEPMP